MRSVWVVVLACAACHGKPAVAPAAPTAAYYCFTVAGGGSACETDLDECNATAMGYEGSGSCEPTSIVYCVTYQQNEGGEVTDCFPALADCQALVATADDGDSGIQSGTMGTCEETK